MLSAVWLDFVIVLENLCLLVMKSVQYILEHQFSLYVNSNVKNIRFFSYYCYWLILQKFIACDFFNENFHKKICNSVARSFSTFVIVSWGWVTCCASFVHRMVVVEHWVRCENFTVTSNCKVFTSILAFYHSSFVLKR